MFDENKSVPTFGLKSSVANMVSFSDVPETSEIGKSQSNAFSSSSSPFKQDGASISTMNSQSASSNKGFKRDYEVITGEEGNKYRTISF